MSAILLPKQFKTRFRTCGNLATEGVPNKIPNDCNMATELVPNEIVNE